MARRAQKREWTVQEFNEWHAADLNVDDARKACAEEGGPRVTLVPDPTSVPQEILLPDIVTVPVTPAEPGDIVSFSPEPSRKVDGWSAARQRVFIESLAETGSVHASSQAAGLSARSAYRLRIRSPAFAAAWDVAQQLAVGRLSALAYDRAINGRIEQVYHEGELVGEKRIPSERLLMWLLSRLDPRRFAAPWERRKDDISDPQAEARAAFPGIVESLTDTPDD